MRITANHKKFIAKILSNEITDIESFANSTFDYEPELYEIPSRRSIGSGIIVNKGDKAKTIIDYNKSVLLTMEFIYLVSFLIKNEIIFIDSSFYNQNQTTLILCCKKESEIPLPFGKFYELTRDFQKKAIIDNELQAFQDRGYKTVEQYELEQEKIDRKKAQNLTKLVSIIAICFSALSLAATIYFNIISIDSETRVRIIENKSIQDSIRVNIENISEIKKAMQDTIIIKHETGGEQQRNIKNYKKPKSNQN